MTKRKLQISILAAAASVGLLFAKVTTDYNHAADFTRFHTYSWIGVKAGNELWTDRIRQDINQQLSARGWQEVPSGGDAAVAAMGSTKNQQTLQTFYNDFGGGWFWGGWDGMATTQVENTPVGTLIVDVFDGHNKKLIWRGVATDTLSEKPDKNEKKLEKSVQDMFEHFPPKSRG